MSDKKFLNCRNVVLITGEKNTGKTLFCIEIIKRLQNTKILVKGLISPGQYRNGEKIGIIARDIQSGKERMLATYSPGWDPEKPEREWLFNQKTFKWGNHILKRSSKTEILIIDELGFLEFEKNSGWKKAFTIIEKGNYHLGFVVVRPSYILNSRKIWNVVDVIEIKNKEFIEEQVDQAIKDYRIHIK